MPLNDIVFVKGQGGLGRPLPGQDFISGLILYNASLPSGLSSSNRIKKMFSPTDADAIGLKLDYADETQATGSFLVTTAGTNGDTVTLKVAETFGNIITLGTYTKVSTDTTATLVATAIAAAINAGTITHGYTASSSTATVTITARKGLGVYLNTATTPLSATYSASATLAGTITQFSGGVASRFAQFRYHINEFFRIQPQGVLYVGIFTVPGGSPSYSEITTMQNYSNGTIRQFGVYKDFAAFAASDATTIDGVCKTLDSQHKNTSALLGADISGTADVSTLTDLSTLTANKCSVVIAQDGAALGAALYLAYGKSVTTLGATLGAAAFAKVSESIAWVGKFNISNGVECDTLAFANGVLFSAATVTDTYLSAVNALRYIFLRKYVGVAGSFFNDGHTAVITSSDYAYIENNRTIDKAIRGIYTNTISDLSSPLVLKVDGTLADTTIAYLISDARKALDQMQRDGEISNYGITIDPTQNVASTSKVVIAVKDIPVGVARNIEVDIMNAKSL